MRFTGLLDIRWAARSEVGGRETNQDTWFEAPLMWAVADGMGGHAAGEVAARLAVEGLAPLGGVPLPGPDELIEAVAAADRSIADAGAAHGPDGIGTTLTGIAMLADEVEADAEASAIVFNVGDSRVYRWRAGELEQLTRDHSLVQELIDIGDLTADEARRDPRRHLITRSLGCGDGPPADHRVIDVRSGDRFVICSDGLTGELTDSEIASHVGAPVDVSGPGVVVDALVDASLEGGAADNVTVVVVTVLGAADHAPEPPTGETPTGG